ncbi:uncharacterized protein LOC125671602 isoform X2 [Ostrea edulis]|uniref:uncharacterized protein LOC125671602 isoform X2 n=1 Tax=Ostrea edulis TaxID=37623 RepID=UPI0024AFBED1|nr:uncharacterized protein LOC125671602 isoform X2 [Ostrea edulis]
MEIFQLILILQLFLVTVIKGQCFGNGTCVCHCVDCSEKCTTCLPGWGGSKDYNCQRRNVLYRAAAGDDKDDKNKLLDEDFSTSLENKDYKPFLRVQLNKSITIDKLDITLLLERGVNYTVYIKDMAYVRTMNVICNKLDQSNNTGKRTVSITCYKPLSGKYLEIVSSEKTRVKIFEIRYFVLVMFSSNFLSFHQNAPTELSVKIAAVLVRPVLELTVILMQWIVFLKKVFSVNFATRPALNRAMKVDVIFSQANA